MSQPSKPICPFCNSHKEIHKVLTKCSFCHMDIICKRLYYWDTKNNKSMCHHCKNGYEGMNIVLFDEWCKSECGSME